MKYKTFQKLEQIIAFSMIIGTVSCLFYFLLVVVNISPWYDPRYFVPIAGMLIGNSMTGISLGVSRLVDGIQTQKSLVEGALMLGATPKMAAKQIMDNTFDSAILPTINSMVGMGIVFLPGMMTGQILSGTSPVTAIEYQIAIIFLINYAYNDIGCIRISMFGLSSGTGINNMFAVDYLLFQYGLYVCPQIRMPCFCSRTSMVKGNACSPLFNMEWQAYC